MQLTWITFLIVCPLIFLAGFIDSIAGGGGIISIPAYLVAGLPVHYAYGTNKFSACCGTTVSAIKYFRGGKVHLFTAVISAVGSLIGAYCGSNLALLVDDRYLRIAIICALPVIAVLVMLRKDPPESQSEISVPKNGKTAIISLLIGLCIGLYDGMFGPGTGTFLIFAYTLFMKFDFTTASGNAKIVNLASNLASVFVYLTNGKVLFLLAIPAAACSILGNYLGSKLALKGGSKIIKPVFFIALGLLLAKIIYDMIAG